MDHIITLPPTVKVLKAPHSIPHLDERCPIDFSLGLVSSAKKDGNRGMCIAGQLFTSTMESPRNERIWLMLENMIAYAAEHQLVLDYELYDPEQSHHAVTSGGINSIENDLPETLGCYVFDCADLDDFVGECAETPYEARIAHYHQVVEAINDPRIIALQQRPCANADEVREHFENDLMAGDEGSILRSLRIQGEPSDRRHMKGGWWKHGRATANQQIIWKMKNYETMDGVIIDIEPRMVTTDNTEVVHNRSGQRKYDHRTCTPTDCVGAFHVSYRNKQGTVVTSKIGFGTGFSLMERELMWAAYKRGQIINRWCEFKHMPHGSKDNGRLRIGQFVRFRDDRAGELL